MSPYDVPLAHLFNYFELSFVPEYRIYRLTIEAIYMVANNSDLEIGIPEFESCLYQLATYMTLGKLLNV